MNVSEAVANGRAMNARRGLPLGILPAKTHIAEARKSLLEAHPDFETVRETNEYKTWLSSKTPAYRKRFLYTWDPAVVIRGLTELKDSLKVRERKQSSTIGGYQIQMDQRDKDLEYLVSVGAKWKAMQPMMDSELPKAVLFFEMLEKWLDDAAKKRIDKVQT